MKDSKSNNCEETIYDRLGKFFNDLSKYKSFNRAHYDFIKFLQNEIDRSGGSITFDLYEDSFYSLEVKADNNSLTFIEDTDKDNPSRIVPRYFSEDEAIILKSLFSPNNKGYACTLKYGAYVILQEKLRYHKKFNYEFLDDDLALYKYNEYRSIVRESKKYKKLLEEIQ